MPATATTPSIRPQRSTPVADDPLAAGQGGHALGHGHGLAAGRLDLADHGLGHLALRVLTGHRHADVGHDDLRALGRGGQGHGPSDASAGAGDGDDLAVQECSHGGLLLLLVCRRWTVAVDVRYPGSTRDGDRSAAGRPPAREVDRLLEPVLASPPGRRHPAPVTGRPVNSGDRTVAPRGIPADRRRSALRQVRSTTARHDDDTGECDDMGDLGFWALAHEYPGAPGAGGAGRHRVLVGRAARPRQPGGARTAAASTSSPATWWPPSSPTAWRCSSCTWQPCRPAGTWCRSITT